MAGSIASRARRTRTGIARKQIAYDFKRPGDRMQPYTFSAPTVVTQFVIPVSGRWKFVAWGGGGRTGSAAYIEVTRALTVGQIVTVKVGRGDSAPPTSDSTVTLPDGTVATAGGANGNTAGVASGGDVNLNGTTGTSGTGANGGDGLGTGGGVGGTGDTISINGGAGAPANLPYRGGPGGAANGWVGGPGAGIGERSAGAIQAGPGLIIATLLGD
jgi:hypothetical protein